MNFKTIGTAPLSHPPLGFRFGVTFLMMGAVPNTVDFRFQSVSGIEVRLETEKKEIDSYMGINTTLPKGLSYSNLVLKRGVLLASPLSTAIETSFEKMQFDPVDILVFSLNELLLPVKIWKFSNAYPIKWAISGLDATQNDVLIEEIELTYSHYTNMAL